MPGPKHSIPRRSGPRPDPEGNPRKANRKSAAKLASRVAGFLPGSGFHQPGSQNRRRG